jgi:hypothetical protein
MQDNNPAGQLGKGYGREMPGGRLNKLFLGPKRRGTKPGEEDEYAGQAILHAVNSSVRRQENVAK